MTAIDTNAATTETNERTKSTAEQFVDDNVLFLGPDPEIMRDHKLSPETPDETAALAAFSDPDQLNLVRHRIQTACNESFDMVEQMGAAPGAKWGDIIAGVWTASGDLALASNGGVLLFSVLTQHPVKFVLKYWADEPTVGIREGDIFMHNDARYGNIHNTDQSLFLPVFHNGRLVCFTGAIVHEGENGAIEPGGMPVSAESPYDEGLKMSPIKVGENFEFRRDLVTFLQNSVREPKLQREGMKAKLYAAMRLRERILAVIEESGEEALTAAMRRTLTDTVVEVRRRLRSWPDGTVRQNMFADSTLRENVLIRIRLAITKRGDELILDYRGSSPQFLNRANNTVLASLKGMLAQEFLTFVWPDLPRNQAVFEPISIICDEASALNCTPDAPNAQSMMTFFPSFSAAQAALPKLLYSSTENTTEIISCWYNMLTTFVYGGVTQHGEIVGNVCADLNGMGGAARSNRDGEHSVGPIFATMADLGEQELVEEEVPMMKFVPHRVMRDNQGFGKFRGGHGYQQIATMKDTDMWGFMVSAIGSKFPSAHGLFGGYGPGSYPLCKVKDVNIFDVMANNPESLRYTIEEIMNERPFPNATYSTHQAGMSFEVAKPGELYMITQGAGGGYGDALDRDPDAVVNDLRDGLISPWTAREIYHVVVDEKTIDLDDKTFVLDEKATAQARTDERKSRLDRALPYEEFVAGWETEAPAEYPPFYGSWDDRELIYAGSPEVSCAADAMLPVMMPNPKDVRIAELETQLKQATADRTLAESD